MTATITIRITPDAQRLALLAGESAAQVQTYPVPTDLLPRLLALPWATVDPDGNVACRVQTVRFGPSELEKPVGTSIEFPSHSGYGTFEVEAARRPHDASEAIAFAETIMPRVLAHLDGERVKHAKQTADDLAQRKAAVDAWASLPVEWRTTVDGIAHCLPFDAPDDYRGPLRRSGRVLAAPADLREWAPRAYAEAEAEVARLAAQRELDREAARVERCRCRRALLTTIVGTTDPDAVLARHDAQLLAEGEVLTIVRGWLETSLGAPHLEDPPDHAEDEEHSLSGDLEFSKVKLSAPQWHRSRALLDRVATLATLVPPGVTVAHALARWKWVCTCDETGSIALLRVTLACGSDTWSIDLAL